MKNESFQSFIDLVTFDKQYIVLKEQREKIKKTLQDLQIQLKTIQDQVSKVLLKKESSHTIIKDKESDIDHFNELAKKQKIVLDAVANNKEYKSAQAELESFQFNRNVLEQELVRLWNRYETIENEYKTIEESSKITIQDIMQKIDNQNKEIVDIDKKFQEYNKSRQVKLIDVSEEWLEVYDMMRGRAKDPVVPVIRDSCSSCFYMVTAQDLQKLKQKVLLQCKDCYRLLYYQNNDVQEEISDSQT